MSKVEARFLSQAQRFKLWNHVQANYAKANESDKKFATAASLELGFPVSDNSVVAAREGLNIPSYRETRTPMIQLSGTVYGRLAQCERLVKQLYTSLGMENLLPEELRK